MKLKTGLRRLAFYSCVGASATVVEWLIFYLVNQRLRLHYAPATVIATVFSGFTNWAVGRLVLFRDTGHAFREIGKIYLTSIVGMGFNLLLMWVMVDGFGLSEMFAKVIATILVFLWNYLIHTRLIYRGKVRDSFSDAGEHAPETSRRE